MSRLLFSFWTDRHDRRYGKKCDVWSLGCIIYVVLSGYHPFDPEGDSTDATILGRSKSGEWNFKDDYNDCWRHISDDAKDLIFQCLQVDPEKRLSAKEVTQHKWFKRDFKATKKEQEAEASASSASSAETRAAQLLGDGRIHEKIGDLRSKAQKKRAGLHVISAVNYLRTLSAAKATKKKAGDDSGAGAAGGQREVNLRMPSRPKKVERGNSAQFIEDFEMDDKMLGKGRKCLESGRTALLILRSMLVRLIVKLILHASASSSSPSYRLCQSVRVGAAQ